MATAPPAAEPMQIGVTHLSGEERERRVRLNLCFYCGLPGHMRASCPTRPSRNNPTVSRNLSQSTFLKITVRLKVKGTIIDTTAFIDSGAAGNFIDAEFAKTHNIPLVSCESHLAVAALDGRPLGSGRIHFTTEDLTLLTRALHTETIRLFVFQSPQTPLILGLPWLERHNPHISWSERQISRWSEFCLQNCLSRTCPEQQQEPCTTSNIPGEYHDLATAFSKTKASQLPPHRSCDCVTDLPPSRGHTTILSVIDRFSKACRLILLPKLPTALETAESLCDHVFRFYGLPEDIVSDRGPPVHFPCLVCLLSET